MSLSTPYAPRVVVPQFEGVNAAGWVFGAIFLYCWMSINPFEDLANPPVGIAAINQLVGFALAFGVLIYAGVRGLFPQLLAPRLLVVLLFMWLALSSLAAPDAGAALRRLFFTGMLCFMAASLLVLPKSREQFTGSLAFCALAVLVLSYLGIILMPARAVHQVYDLVEPGLAGDWRGVFNHKNIAAQATVILVFVGLYVAGAGHRGKGWLIVLLAGLFLWMTNGKTALGMLPVALLLAALLVRRPIWGGLVFWLVLAFVSVFTLGSALSPNIYAFIEGLGMDPTFTARTEIWDLALKSAADHLLFGYGFGNFWGSDMLTSGPYAQETWAVDAAHAHHGFIEALLHGGVPALLLTLVWLVMAPLRNIGLAKAKGADQGLTTLFARIWVFCILSALLESNFFTGTGPVWFSLILAVAGLRQQAQAYLVVEGGTGGKDEGYRHVW